MSILLSPEVTDNCCPHPEPHLRGQVYQVRSRVSDVKKIFRGKYENFECEICKIEYETQQHIIEYKEINKNRKEEKIIPKYEELYKRNVKNQVIIVRHFLENMKMKKKLEK